MQPTGPGIMPGPFFYAVRQARPPPGIPFSSETGLGGESGAQPCSFPAAYKRKTGAFKEPRPAGTDGHFPHGIPLSKRLTARK